jgi:hypothetical protein
MTPKAVPSFQDVMCARHVIGKKMEGTGLSDILLEAGLIGSGSVTGVMTGKHYSRAMHCHKILLEALERLFIMISSSNFLG